MRDRAALIASAIVVYGVGKKPPNFASDVAVLVALSQAESSGFAQACNQNTDGSIDRGLWQINSSHGYGQSSYDPVKCAQQAWAVFKSQGPTAWTTYGGLRYLTAWPAARIATLAVIGSNTGSVLPSRAPVGSKGAPAPSTATPEQPAGTTQTSQCVYHTQFAIPLSPSIPLLGQAKYHQDICWDFIIGSIKMGIGGFGVLVSTMGLAFVLSKQVPGGREAASAVSRAGGKLPAGRAYRTVTSTPARARAAKTKRVVSSSARTVATERAAAARSRRAAQEQLDADRAERSSAATLRARQRPLPAADAGIPALPRRSRPKARAGARDDEIPPFSPDYPG